ncbi:MAG TPA: 2Fe-2S iron-sulfur cluster-binding protein [Fontimonas sp.]
MKQTQRQATGGLIDRSRTLHFTFDGRRYTGHPGDTLASALLANGVKVTGRSFKYHRPRGLLGAGFEEPNTLVQLEHDERAEPNLKATQVELYDGLVARAVNCWPSARFDLLGVLRHFKAFMPSGFYYKTFIWPGWHWFETLIRAAAGLGVSPRKPDPDCYDKRHDNVDVLVVGGGRHGLESAIAAATAGRRVLLMDDRPVPGGSLRYEPAARADLDRLLQEAAKLPSLRIVNRSTVFGYYDHDHLLAVQALPDGAVRQRLWHIRAREVVLATGAIERPVVFPNNDRPGVMLAGAARQYLHLYGVRVGQDVVIATNNDSAYAVAAELADAGLRIVAVIDSRERSDGAHVKALEARGVRIEWQSAPTDTRGAQGISAVEFHRVDAQGRAVPKTGQRLACDCLLVSGGWNPTVHLFSQAGGVLKFDERLQSFVPLQAAQHDRSVGAAAGKFDTELRQGTLWSVDVGPLGRSQAYSWVDYASDVTDGDLRLAVRENFAAVEHLKRYTTTGMMADQGKTSNVNAIGILGGVLGKAPGEVGTTRFRPPFNPVSFGAIAGQTVGPFYHPLRQLPTDALQRAAGAQFEDYGGWSRPVCVPRAGESEHAAVLREVKAVRSGVGIIDYSPLGKILVHGPDAATLLQRMYVNNMKTLKTGFCRYGVMLGEDGIVMDDGVLTRWSELTYQVGTTSGNAERITDWLEEWLQCEWVDLDVIVEPVTTQWAVTMVAGPQARRLLQRLGCDIDLSAAAFPHMAAREGRIGAMPVRIMRVSFTGELSYEVSVPWRHGAAFWQRLLEEGKDLGVTPFGIEALMIMRTEKGYLHVGSETDGSTMPQDIGFQDIIARKTEDFVGRRSTMTPEGLRADRMQLVGLQSLNEREVLPIGAHIVGAAFKHVPGHSQGWVTSSFYSPSLDRPVALALVARGRARLGETVKVYDARHGGCLAARIVEQVAYDPSGERINA